MKPVPSAAPASSQTIMNAAACDSSTTAIVLRMVTLELARDGGAALVTSLKDYLLKFQHVSTKRFNALLVQSSNVGKPKLLAFLESHPTVFRVDRSQSPHWVTLVEPASASSSDVAAKHEEPSFLNEILKEAEIDSITQNDLQAQAYHKALLVLRKRDAKTRRRQKRSEQATNTDGDNSLVSTDWVNTHWLLAQCSWELHSYLRACQFYVQSYRSPEQVQPVGSRKWEAVVLQQFEHVLLTCAADESNEHDKIQVQNGKARLQSNKVPDNMSCNNHHPPDSSQKLELNEEQKLLQEIDRLLTEIVVRKDGGHQITLGLLLHRYPNFKRLLGGRDLWQLYQRYGSNDNDNNNNSRTVLFQDVIMFLSDRNDLVLQSKRPKTTVIVSGDEISDHNNDDSAIAAAGKGKRMKVDEEGLFSVTNRKWGRAMANFMVRACKDTNLFDDESSPSSATSKQQKERIAIDLTASVGGMTLGLARAKYFDRIIALEIDSTRAKLCKENMEAHGYDDLVDVCNKDSVEQLSLLPRYVCIVIDPPWGGFDYKGLVREEAKKKSQGSGGRPRNHLKLGDTLLEDVLEKIAHNNAPCVVGIRLPVNYNVHGMLLDCLQERNIEHKSLLVRKVGVQLFAVICFGASEALESPSTSSS